MGAGALVELIARGNQDIFLIGNPQYSYFSSVYRRHTNFSIEPIKQIFMETPDFGKRVTCTIEKKGDLLHDILLEVKLPALKPYVSWTNGIGNFMIEYVELQLGGETFDRISGNMLDTWMELSTNNSVKNGLYSMIGKKFGFNSNTQTDELDLLIPLPFWFCRDIARSLPLIALQYFDVRIVVQFKSFDKCWFKKTSETPDTPVNIKSCNLLCNYIYLDVFERSKMATQKQFEYLIEQFQENPPIAIAANTISLNPNIFFNHDVKELFWMFRSTDAENYNDYYNYGNVSNYNTVNEKVTNPFVDFKLRFNGNDRMESLETQFYRFYQPYKHHSAVPLNAPYIYLYSFAISPEELQPSGTANFSKLDNTQLCFTCSPNITTGTLYIYALSYNVIRIQNGMAGLMFSS